MKEYLSSSMMKESNLSFRGRDAKVNHGLIFIIEKASRVFLLKVKG